RSTNGGRSSRRRTSRPSDRGSGANLQSLRQTLMRSVSGQSRRFTNVAGTSAVHPIATKEWTSWEGRFGSWSCIRSRRAHLEHNKSADPPLADVKADRLRLRLRLWLRLQIKLRKTRFEQKRSAFGRSGPLTSSQRPNGAGRAIRAGRS